MVEFDSIHGSIRWISPTFNDFQHKALHAVIISRILGDMGKKMWPKNGGSGDPSRIFSRNIYRSVKQGFFLKNWFASFSMGHIDVDPSDVFGLMIS